METMLKGHEVSYHMVLPNAWADHSGKVSHCRGFSAMTFEWSLGATWLMSYGVCRTRLSLSP